MSDSTFSLSEVQREFRDALRAFSEEKVAPHAAEADRNAEFPWKSYEACRQMELPALGVPEAYGGAGADSITQAIAVEELARGLRVDGSDRPHLQARDAAGDQLGK